MNEVSQIEDRIAELEALRDHASMIDDWFRVDVLNDDIRTLRAELYDLDVVPRETFGDLP